MSNKFVTHPGFIKSISNSTAEVAIIAKSGCASCEISGSCSVSDTQEKIIDVSLPDNHETYKIGQSVMIKMKQSSGVWAILFGYVFPFLVIVATLILLSALNFDQGLAGILSLATLIPYYFVMYLSRDFFKKNFDHSIV
ncbi:MAG: RseC/MucC family positive regulator of sigma(E) [Bacteroidetes bacterium]|nr:MAG: RseC/MucC family positive regulator of sigma(E) [Bacteroidota bacterium]